MPTPFFEGDVWAERVSVEHSGSCVAGGDVGAVESMGFLSFW